MERATTDIPTEPTRAITSEEPVDEASPRKTSPAFMALAAVVVALAGGTGYQLAPAGAPASPPPPCECQETEREVEQTMAGYDHALDALLGRVTFLEQLIPRPPAANAPKTPATAPEL